MDRQTFLALGGCPHCWPADLAGEPTRPITYSHPAGIVFPAEAATVHGHPIEEANRDDPAEPELVRRAMDGDR